MKVRDVIKRLEADGWRQVTQKGSHRQFTRPVKAGKVTVMATPAMRFLAGCCTAFGSKQGYNELSHASRSGSR